MAAFQRTETVPRTRRKELNTGIAADDNPITGSAIDKNPEACSHAYTRAHASANTRSDIAGNTPSDSHRHGPAAGY